MSVTPVQETSVTLSWLRSRKDAVVEVVRRHRALEDVRVFGSVARGDAGPSSDVDLLVTFADDATLFDLVALSEELTTVLGVHVDVVSSAARGSASARARAQAVSL